MFLIRTRLVPASVLLFMVGWWVALGHLRVMADGSQPGLGLRAFMTVIGAAGTFVLVVLPGFLLYRALFTTAPALSFAPGEAIFATATASHVLAGEGRGGKVVLTEQRVAFVPHRFNVQLDTVSLPWDEIASVGTADSMAATAVAALLGVGERAMQHGLDVVLRDGRRERFVALRRVEVARSLERLRQAPAGQRGARLAALRDAGELTGLQASRG